MNQTTNHFKNRPSAVVTPFLGLTALKWLKGGLNAPIKSPVWTVKIEIPGVCHA